MSRSQYTEVTAQTIPSVRIGKASMGVIAGGVGSISGLVTKIAANPFFWDVLLPEHSEIELPITDGHTALAYVFEAEGIFGRVEF